MTLDAIAAIPILIWLYLLLGRGFFWRVGHQFSIAADRRLPPARIVAVIPARDEAEGIARAVTSLLSQHLPLPLHVIVVNDGSTDSTAQIANAAAHSIGKSGQLTVLEGQPLAPGWTGKLWAVSQGIAHARHLSPDYLLLTDADIEHGPENVAQLLAIAEAGPFDLTSYMVKLTCITRAERALIPAFVYFFLQLYPPAWISSRTHADAGAAGGCMLVRAESLHESGGIAAIRDQVIDDCALARAIKRRAGRVWLGLTDSALSLRSYETFSEIGRMISRTAFNQLRHSALLLTATLLGLFVTYLLPMFLLFSGRPLAIICGAIAWLLMSVSYLPMVRFYRLSRLWSLTLPAIAAFYAGATFHSALSYWCGRGGRWKGRVQDARRP